MLHLKFEDDLAGTCRYWHSGLSQVKSLLLVAVLMYIFYTSIECRISYYSTYMVPVRRYIAMFLVTNPSIHIIDFVLIE